MDKTVPKTWNAWGKNITDNFKLAFATNSVKEQVSGLTKSLVNNLVGVAIKHYQSILSEAYNFLLTNSRQMSEAEFKNSVDQIRRWAKNQLGSKLTPTTLDEATGIVKMAFVNSKNDFITSKKVATNMEKPTPAPTVVSNRFECLSSDVSHDTQTVVVEAEVSKAKTTSRKTPKPDNSGRFFLHSQQRSNEDLMLGSQCSSSSSQCSASSPNHGAPPPTSGHIVHKVSMDNTAKLLSSSSANTVLIGDENWGDFLPVSCDYCDFSLFLCSGKITAFRAIIDKIKNKCLNVKKLVVCVSSNNLYSTTSISLFRNIFKGLLCKFPLAKLFICLPGISDSFSTDGRKILENISSTIRKKSNKFILINPPDNFSVERDFVFTKETKLQFYKSLNSFLC